MMRSAPLIQFSGVVKDYGGREPLRIRALSVGTDDHIAMSGLDEPAAETMVHLISGAALPDEGSVVIAGQDTREIATDTDWLLSLDRFGVVTRRAVLLDTLSTAANMALPMTTSIDPMTDETRHSVERLAAEVGLAPDRLDAACGSLNALDRVRLHFARALALDPALLLLEHATQDLRDDHGRIEIGRALKRVAATRGVGWLAFDDDRVFATESGGQRWRLDAATGQLVRQRWWQR
jgi:ABC-type transporter Mla maintaining outer membrane lipid asymmetry ATPase subunit MlaF